MNPNDKEYDIPCRECGGETVSPTHFSGKLKSPCRTCDGYGLETVNDFEYEDCSFQD